MKRFYNENYKTLMKETEEHHPSKMERHPLFRN
jgi:hypothetical protein